jgi:hypothetical protein
VSDCELALSALRRSDIVQPERVPRSKGDLGAYGRHMTKEQKLRLLARLGDAALWDSTETAAAKLDDTKARWLAQRFQRRAEHVDGLVVAVLDVAIAIKSEGRWLAHVLSPAEVVALMAKTGRRRAAPVRARSHRTSKR